MDPSQLKGVITSDVPERETESSSSQVLSRNNVETLEKCLSQQLSHRTLASILALQRLCARLIAYARKHPFLFALQVLGVTALIISLITIPVLGAAGFSTIGPVAGSTAAAWQAGIGLVQAGSLFAFCQSAAMGGAAVGIIAMTGTLGGVAAIAPVIHQLGDGVANLGHRLAPVVQEVGRRVGDFGNIVKDKLCAFWH